MKSYFFLCSYPLKPGSVVLPGNWGRILALYKAEARKLRREAIFEEARLKIAPEAPSRFSAAFVFDSIDVAVSFLPDRPLDLLYLVDLEDEQQPTFRADMKLVPQPDMEDSLIREHASRYWSGHSSLEEPEILTLSALVIREQLTIRPRL